MYKKDDDLKCYTLTIRCGIQNDDFTNTLLSFQGSLITAKTINHKTMISWSHRCIANIAKQRYFETVDAIKKSHKDIGNIFLDRWQEPKPLVFPERNIEIIDEGKRFVSEQPLLYCDTRYNMRRLSELWFQLLNCGKYIIRIHVSSSL